MGFGHDSAKEIGFLGRVKRELMFFKTRPRAVIALPILCPMLSEVIFPRKHVAKRTVVEQCVIFASVTMEVIALHQ